MIVDWVDTVYTCTFCCPLVTGCVSVRFMTLPNHWMTLKWTLLDIQLHTIPIGLTQIFMEEKSICILFWLKKGYDEWENMGLFWIRYWFHEKSINTRIWWSASLRRANVLCHVWEWSDCIASVLFILSRPPLSSLEWWLACSLMPANALLFTPAPYPACSCVGLNKDVLSSSQYHPDNHRPALSFH